MTPADPTPPVLAAGGVVWRRRGGRVELVLVHRPPPRDDWSFPKGKLDPGERHRDAALREVHEETGLVCRLGPKLAEASYVTPRGEDKRVRWWAMTVESDDGFTPNPEIDGLRWVPVERVASELTYPDDRDLVHALVTSGELDRP